MVFFKHKRLTKIMGLSKQAFGKYKWQITILTILGFFGGLLEGIGVNALIPLLSFVVGDGNKGSDIISRSIEKFFLYFNIDFTLKYLLIFIVVLFILKAIVLIFSSYIKIKITADYENYLRNNLLNKILNANWSYLLKQKLGHLETILMTDVRQGAILLDRISGMVIIITSLIVYVFVAINISANVTFFALIFGAFLFIIFKPFIKRTKIAARSLVDINKEVAHYINENIFGIKTVKAVFVGDKVAEIGKDFFLKLKQLKIKILLLKNITGVIIQPMGMIFISIIFAYSYKTQDFNFAALLAIVYLIQRIFQYIQQLQATLHSVNEVAPHLRDVLFYEEMAVKNTEENHGNMPFIFNDNLKFKDVKFSYNHRDTVLSDINFIVKKGEMVGIIGPSGGGKTTIFDLILRLFNPTGGRILMDGKDISDIDIAKWRKNIGYVSQDIFLINDTVWNNIRFHNDSISDKEVEEAAKMADIYDFIQTLPNKFSTIIGERGVLLSAGQRQRIIIARILARKPKLLILDEATSALDSESELKIQKIIENLKGKMTILVIAHRLSTVINSDRLLILDDGRITEEGSPKELLKDKTSYFYKIYNIRK